MRYKMKGTVFIRRFVLSMLILVGLFLPLDLFYGSYYKNQQRIDFDSRQIGVILKALDRYDPDVFAYHDKTLAMHLDRLQSIAGLGYFFISDHSGNILYAYPSQMQEALGFIAKHSDLLDKVNKIYDDPAAFLNYLEVSGTRSMPELTLPVKVDGEAYIHTAQLLLYNPELVLGFGVAKKGRFDASSSFVFSQGPAAVVALLLISLALVMVIRSIVRPVNKLTVYAQKVAAHDFTATLDVSVDNEIGELASAMRSMANEIADYVARMEEKIKNATSYATYSLEQFSTIIDSVNDGLLVLDADKTVVRCNLYARRLFNWPHNVEGQNLEMILSGMAENNPDSGNLKNWKEFFHNLDSSQEFVTELALLKSHLMLLEVHVTRKKIIDRQMIICMFRDVTTRHNMEEELRRSHDNLESMIQARTSEFMRVNAQLRLENAERRTVEQALLRAEARYRDIVDNAIEGVFQRSPDGRFLSANPALARILGYANADDLLTSYLAPGQLLCHTPEMERALTELLEIRGWVSGLEFQARMQDGSPVWVSMNARRVTDNTGETLYYEAFLEDITSRKKTEEKLVHQAFHDPLTGLPNRTLFLDRLNMVLRKAKRHEDYNFAVLYLDLDRFKNINDIFGHSAGDEILTHAARQLQLCVREADTVARFGGDEFALLLDDIEQPNVAIDVARRICKSLNQSIVFHEQEVRTSASIGIVINGLNYSSPEEVLRDADTAMYRAKKHERRQFMVFNERMREETEENLSIEYDLHRAIERDEILVYYQPLIEMATGKVYGFEALMRWNRQGTMVSPVRFIPIAEESDLINALGMYLLRRVCMVLKLWERDHGITDITMHVNISSRQFMAPNFSREVEDILSQTKVNPRLLIFEITESVLLDYGSQVIAMMRKFQEMGIRFCLDDFGTGFSSLSYLRILPLESMKIDRSFIMELETDPLSIAILRNLISMGHDIGLSVVTEGIERLEQVKMLLPTGCRFAQGYYFSMPLKESDALEFSLNNERMSD